MSSSNLDSIGETPVSSTGNISRSLVNFIISNLDIVFRIKVESIVYEDDPAVMLAISEFLGDVVESGVRWCLKRRESVSLSLYSSTASSPPLTDAPSSNVSS